MFASTPEEGLRFQFLVQTGEGLPGTTAQQALFLPSLSYSKSAHI